MRILKIVTLVISVILTISSVGSAQQSSGTIEVTVSLENIQGFQGYSIRIFESKTRAKFGEYKIPQSGMLSIHDVPFASYDIWLVEGGDAIVSRKKVVVSSTVSQKIALGQKSTSDSVIVESQAADVSRASVSTIFPAATIASLPAMSGPKKMEAILLNTPGVVPDEDGRLHIRGEDAQLQYIVDGIPITTNQTRIYSSLFNAGIIKAAEVIRGGLNAEYGVATSGIININTRSGFDAPLFADGSASYGSFGTHDRTLSVGGNIGGRVALFCAYGSSETDRYLDPTHSAAPNHTDGYTHNYFAKADFLLTDDIDLVLLGTNNLANFGIANGKITTPAQDQRQDVSDYMYAGRLNISLNNSSALSLLGYKRHVEATNTSGGLLQIKTSADSLKAVSENEDFFIGAHRVDEATGGQVEYSAITHWFDAVNNIKVGVGGESYPLQEFFTFAVTNPMKSDPAFAGGDDRLQPYDLTRPGGKPFLVDQSKTGSRFSIYAQDQIALTDWIINAGVRYDMYKLFEEESDFSPRLSAAYRINDDLWIRGSYNRIMMQAPLENILVSSSDEAKTLVGSEQGAVPLNVMSEKEHVVEIGASYKLNEHIDIDLNGYAKFIDNFIVKVELGVSGIIFPVNIKQGQVLGGELEVRLHDWNNFSGRLAFATCDSRGAIPSDGSTPIAAGLIIGEEGENYSHPFKGEDMFQTEHNQVLTASFTLNYDHPSGFFATLGGRFDSGLPFDLADSNGVGLDVEQSKAELKRRGYGDDVIDLLNLNSDKPGSPDKSTAPHGIFDLSAGYNFETVLKIPAKITATVLNVLDTKYLYKFESVFGGTHFGLPRVIMLSLQLHI